MTSWIEYQVQSRFNPEHCPGADHSWSNDGDPRPSYARATDRLEAWSMRDEYKDFRIVRKSCAVMDAAETSYAEGR